MNRADRPDEYLGPLHLSDIDWYFHVYLKRGNQGESISRDDLWKELTTKVQLLAAEYLSSEFAYIRSGFAIAHYGNRGVTYSFWHWADWKGTWEWLCQAWYCYGRNIGSMLPLDRKEPILCQYELDLLIQESTLFGNIIAIGGSYDELATRYRRSRS